MLGNYFTYLVLGLNVIFIISMVNVFRLIKTLLKKLTRQLDELEQKTVFDSLAISMLMIVGIHLIQWIIGVYTHSNGIDYTPIIAPWAYLGRLSINFSHQPFFVRIDSLTFDVFVIGLVYLYMQLSYRLINKKQALKMYGLPVLILLVIFVGGKLLSS